MNTEKNRNAKTKQIGLLILKLGVVIGAYEYLYRKFNFKMLREHFFEIDVRWFLLAMGFTAAMYLFAGLRWRRVIQAMGDRLAVGPTLKIFLIGMFFSQFLFASIGGDAVRIWLTKRQHLSLRTSFNSTFFDRLAGLISIAFFMLLSFPVYDRVISNPHARASLWLALFLVIGAMLILLQIDRIPFLSRLSFFQASFGKIAPDARQVFCRMKNATGILAYSLVVLSLTCLIVFSLGRALHQGLPVYAYFVMLPPVLLITVLPISLGGWGVREGAMVVAFGFLGMAGETAITLSIWFGIVLLLASIPGGVLWLGSKKDVLYSPSY